MANQRSYAFQPEVKQDTKIHIFENDKEHKMSERTDREMGYKESWGR